MDSLASLSLQLKECQDKLRECEARRDVLADENKRLIRENEALRNASQSVAGKELPERNFSDVAERGPRAVPPTDELVSELQKQLTDLLRRNTQLERECVSQHSAMRRQYERHIESLELELRRIRALVGANAESPASLHGRTPASYSIESKRHLL